MPSVPERLCVRDRLSESPRRLWRPADLLSASTVARIPSHAPIPVRGPSKGSVAGAEAGIDADAWRGIGRGAAARLAGRDALRGGRALLMTSAHPYRPRSAAGAAVAGRTLPAVQRACHPIGTVGGGITDRAPARAASARSTRPSPASDTHRSAGAAVSVRLRGAASRHPKDGAENYKYTRAVHGTSSTLSSS